MRIAWLALLALIPGAAFAQDDDRGYLTAFLEDNLSGAGRKVTVTGFEGALSSRATIERLTIADDQGIWITLEDVVLDWNRSALLRGDVSVNALTAALIRLDRVPQGEAAAPSPEAAPFALPELPVSVNIGQIRADQIILGDAVLGTEISGQFAASAALSGGQGTIDLTLERTDDGPDGLIALQAGYANTTGELRLSLTAEEAAGGIVAGLLDIPGAPALGLRIEADDPLSDFRADLNLTSDGQERLTGFVVLKGENEAGTAFSADLSGDLAPLFLPDYAEFFGDAIALQAEGRREASGRLDLSRLGLETRALVLNGSLVMAADGLPERFDLTGQLGSPDGLPVLLPLTSDVQTRVARADLTLAYDRAKGEGWRGRAALQGLSRSDLAADQVQITGSGRISRGTSGAAPVVGATLRFDASGLSPTDPAVARALGPAIGGGATLYWQEGAESLSLPRLGLAGQGYALSAGGRIEGLSTGLRVTGKVQADLTDLARLSDLAGRPLSGAAGITAVGTGSPLSGALDLTATIEGQDLTLGHPEADNLLRGPSRIQLSALRDETGTTLRQLAVNAQSLTLAGSGTIATAGSDISANLDFADLSVLGGPYRGGLSGTARFTGTPDSGQVTLDAKGSGLAIGQAEVDRLLAGPSTVRLRAGLAGTTVDVQELAVTAATLEATAQGRLDPAGSDITARARLADLSVLGGGYRGALNADLRATGTAEAGKLRLTGTGSGLAIGQPETDRLLAGQSQLAIDVSSEGRRLRIDRATLSNPQLSASATGGIDGATRNLALEARLANLALVLPDFPGPLTVSGTAVEGPGGYTLDLTGRGPGGIDARVTGTLAPGLRSAALQIRGSAQAGLANVFIDPRSLSGRVGFDLGLNGPLAPASLSGRVTLTDGRISDPDLPFALQGVQATADLAGGQARITAETTLTTRGTIGVTGSVGLAAPFDANLSATLRQVVVRDPELYETRVNGAVTVRGPLTGGATIGGTVELNETELRVPSTGLTGAGMLEGLQHVNEPAPVRETRRRAGLLDAIGGASAAGAGRPFGLDLTINAPSRVFIRGRGLDAELGGSLYLGGTTAAIVPSGGFQLVRGRLDILGKRLNLSEATLQLEGDFNAYLRILASNESDGIISSVQIEGTLADPKVSFVSSPELPEEEVLSRLLFGRGLSSLSALQAVQLAGAVATLAGRGGEGVISKLRKGFGLDDLDLATDADGNTSVKAGKYLSRNLYTEIEVDQQGQSEIHLNLDITPDIKLRGSVGADGGTSLGVFLEKDY
jgi:translocation and assembly module TamB